MKKYVCFGAYEPKSIRTRIYVAIKHSFASFDCGLVEVAYRVHRSIYDNWSYQKQQHKNTHIRTYISLDSEKDDA